MTTTSGADRPGNHSGRSHRAVRAAGFASIVAGMALAAGMLAIPITGNAASGSVTAPTCGHQSGLNNPTNTHNKVLDSYYFSVTDNGTTTDVCSLHGNVKAGDIVTAHFVMDAAAPAGSEVTLVSNNAPPPNPHQQTLFDCASFGDTGGAGDSCNVSSTNSLTVNVPTCGFQVDLIYGEPITPLTQGTYLLQHRFIDGDEGKNPACTPPTISTTANPTTTTVGQTIKDTATVTPSTTTGTVTFNLFAPTDSSCSGTPVFSSSAALSGGQATSGGFVTVATGTYHWIASMTSPALASACADEPVVVTAASTPTISTVASAGGVVGTAITDSATVTGPSSFSGNVIFRLYGPNDATCTTTPIATDTEAISSAGTAHTTQTIAPATAGTYQWQATYTGSTPNLVSTCGSEPVTLNAGGSGNAGGGGVQGISTGVPSTGAALPLPLGAGLVLAGFVTLVAESRLRRRLG